MLRDWEVRRLDRNFKDTSRISDGDHRCNACGATVATHDGRQCMHGINGKTCPGSYALVTCSVKGTTL